MLAGLRQAAPAALRQCRSNALSVARSGHQIRSVASSPVLRESLKPTWVKTTTDLSSRPQWDFLISAAENAKNQRSRVTSPEDIWKNKENTDVKRLPRPNDAYSGRSVPVIKGDVSLALTKLKGILTINGVRATNIRDERHEKKGEKRNRLKSQRWRRRFAHEVRKKVQLVNEIRARGA